MSRPAFTLIELLAVIAIIGIISSIAIVNLSSSRSRAKIAAGQQFSTSINHFIGDQLIGEWLFGGSAADTSGKGNNGTLIGGPVAGTGYDGGGAYVLNGSSQYISIPSIAASTFANTSFTWTTWIKGKTNDLGVNYMPTIGFGGGTWFRLGFRQINGVWEFDQIYDGSNQAMVQCGPAVSANEWVFLAVSATYGGNVVCYQNGVTGASSPYINNVTSATGFAIGHSINSAWAEYIQGSVDDTRLFSSALTLAAIRQQYQLGRASHAPTLAAITTP